MKARLFLILLFLCLSTVMFMKDKYEIFNSFTTLIFNKEITVNTEIIISLIVLITLMFLFLIGGIEKLFFYKNKEKKIEND
mgnify:FL=1